MQGNFWLTSKSITAYGLGLLALAEIVDLTIVTVAIPQMMGAVGANLNSIAFVTTSYVVASAIFICVSGSITKKWGKKRVVLISAILFTISSVFCGLSNSLAEMIFFRIAQGVAGAFLPSVAQSYIAEKYQGNEKQKMMAFFGLIVAMGPVLGPIFGGALTYNLSWRWVFYINVPICITGFLFVYFFMEKDIQEDIEIDYISFLFIIFGVGFLEFFIDSGNEHNWFDSIEMIGILATSLVSLVFFIWRGLLLGRSAINLTIFKSFNFNASCIAMFMFTMAVSAAFAYFPTFLQQIYHYPVNTAGYITAPRGVSAVISAPFISMIANRIGARLTICIGIVVFALSCFLISNYSPEVSERLIIIAMILQGMAIMLFYIPLMEICFLGFPDHIKMDVSGVFNFFRNFGCSVGASLAATIISHGRQINYYELGSHISPDSTGYAWWTQQLVQERVPETLQIAIAQAQVMMQSLYLSYLDSFYIFGLLLLAMIGVPFTLSEPDVVNTADV